MRVLSASAGRELATPASLMVTGVFYMMVVSVLGGLWLTAADATGGSIAGYGATALFWYIATAEAATVALPIKLIDDIGTDIGSGRFEVELLRPVPALAVRIASEVGAMLPRMMVCVVVGVGLASIVTGGPRSFAGLALAFPSLLLALTLNLVVQHGFAAASFWVRESKAAWFLYQKTVFVVGGMLLPLEVLPSTMESVARRLPFMAMAYAPARLASGHVEPELLAIQLGWLAVMTGVVATVFAYGQRRMLRSGS